MCIGAIDSQICEAVQCSLFGAHYDGALLVVLLLLVVRLPQEYQKVVVVVGVEGESPLLDYKNIKYNGRWTKSRGGRCGGRRRRHHPHEMSSDQFVFRKCKKRAFTMLNCLWSGLRWIVPEAMKVAAGWFMLIMGPILSGVSTGVGKQQQSRLIT